MTSTYLSYRIAAQDLTKSLAQVAAQPNVAREAQCYKDNIGKVKTVDDFLGDRRLYAYAMKAYGLQDMTYAKGFMKKVLTSDLSDTSSFANRLSDTRYRDFAKAFDFSESGYVQPAPLIQSDSQEQDTIGLYGKHDSRAATKSIAETTYYNATIGSIRNVDQLLADDRLRTYVLASVGLDPQTSSGTLRLALTGGAAGISAQAGASADQAWTTLAAQFNFSSDGTLPTGTPAQSAAQQSTVTDGYTEHANGGVTPEGAQADASYYAAHIGNVTSVDDLLADHTLYKVALMSAGIDPAAVSPATIADVLTSDPLDPSSFVNRSGLSNFRNLAQRFGFQTDGKVPAGASAQTADQITSTTDSYKASYNGLSQLADQKNTAYYKSHIGQVTSVDALMRDQRLFAYVLTAYDIDPSQVRPVDVANALRSDPTDVSNALHKPANAKLLAMAQDFNFTDKGSVATPRIVQSDKGAQTTISAYVAAATLAKTAPATIRAESTYYQSAIQKIGSLDDLLKDKRIVDYLTVAFGIPKAHADVATLRKLLTSDLNRNDSVANQLDGGRYRDLANAFNFDASGRVIVDSVHHVQTSKEVGTTSCLYLQQQLETDTGTQNEGARLALYFQRKAAHIRTPYDILADKALLQVTQTALNIPSESGTASIDAQAKYITDKLNISDLQDPAQLQKFLSRFSVLYDLNNPSSQQDSAQSLAASLLGQSQPTAIGFSQDLLASLQKVRSAG